MKKIKDYMKEHHMVVRGDRVIAGVSGGADSVCLFFVLSELGRELGFELVAVHVNHGLRGGAADADERFVKELCGRHGVLLEVFRVKLELIAKNRKQSLEEAGRDIRREAFLTAAKKYGANKIALAHHQNDNAETLLWNLCRGSGLTGMGGIRPVSGAEPRAAEASDGAESAGLSGEASGVCYIRPLLCMTREEIEAFLESRGQPYCTDETNAGTDYTRNRIRHLVLPALEQEINAQSVRHMNETMRQLLEVQEYMEAQARAAREECTAWEANGRCLIDKERFFQYPYILRTFILRGCVRRLQGDLTNFGRTHVEAVLGLFDKQAGKTICLPRGMTARRVYEGVELCRTACPQTAPAYRGGVSAGPGNDRGGHGAATPTEPVPLNIPGETFLSEWGLLVRCEVIEKPISFSVEEIPENIYTKWFDYDIIKKGVRIRGREPGDFITIDRAGHTSRLKSWFINEKIPARERTGIPLMACGSDILWIIGYRMSCAYQVSGRTRHVLQVEVRKETAGEA